MMTADHVIGVVCRALGGSADELKQQSRGRADVAWRRAVAMALHHGATRSFSATGRAFGRDRTTVRHAVAKVREKLSDAGFRTKFKQLQRDVER